MKPSLVKALAKGPVDRRELLLWLSLQGQSGSSEPSYLIDENQNRITFGGDRILVKHKRG